MTDVATPQAAPVTPPTSNPWVPMWNLGPTAYDLRYNGDYAAGSYTDGDIVVYNGVTYLCVRPTSAAPTPWTTLGASPSPSVAVYRATAYSIPHAAWTAVPFDTVRYDNSSQWVSGSPTRLTCKVAGTYDAAAYVQMGAAANGSYRVIALAVNGLYVAESSLAGATITGAASPRLTASSPVQLNVGDYVEVHAYQDSGAALALAGGANEPSQLSMALLGGQPGPPGPATPVTYSTSLPASPVDGQEAILVDSVTNPSYQWRFRWNAGSTSAYKWEFVGGTQAWLHNETGTYITPANTWVNPIGASFQFVVPRSGEYQVDFSGRYHTTGAAADIVSTGFGVQAATSPSSGAWTTTQVAGTNYQLCAAKESRLVAAAGQYIQPLLNSGVTTTSIDYPRFFVQPVRVS